MPVSPLAPKAFPDLPTIKGVRFAAAKTGHRYKNRLDVMLAEIAPGSSIAGVFTRSATRAAPVLWCQSALKERDRSSGAALLVNAGNANAFTGKSGVDAVKELANATGSAMGLAAQQVFVASTGVIGEPLDWPKITVHLEAMVGTLDAKTLHLAAEAIRTTDTFSKGAANQVDLGAHEVAVAGIAKGSGMIAPDMATMLSFVFTDAAVAEDLLQAEMVGLADLTFNSITVDSDTSTSDTLMLVATGQSGMPAIKTPDDPRWPALRNALHDTLLDLAQQVVRDGEGATKFVEVVVTGAVSDASAKTIARAIADSPLVKTAIAGEDPNWGRVVMAVGKAGEPADRDRLSIWFGDIEVATAGWVSPAYREELGAHYMKGQNLVLTVDVGVGSGSGKIWTCDLTHGYISINADYRS